MNQSTMDFKQYLSGEKLFGDDFDLQSIGKWFEEEAEGYFHLIKENADKTDPSRYQYHRLNTSKGFRHLPEGMVFKHALGIGSSYGHEFLPIADRLEKITILEPSENMISQKIGKILPAYERPSITGELPFGDNSFDLITCFGTLHHIPNVGKVLAEMIRVTAPGGYLLIREPIRSMGDWRKPRPGMTKNERGIPVNYFRNKFKKANVEVIKESFCESFFALKVLYKYAHVEKGSKIAQMVDNLFSSLFAWNITYHPASNFQKIAPASIFYVIRKK